MAFLMPLVAFSVILFFSMVSDALPQPQLTQSGQMQIWRFIDRQFSRPVEDYALKFGPIISSESHPLGKGSKVITEKLTQNISVTYLLVEFRAKVIVTNVEARGLDAWRKLGLDIQSVTDIEILLGKPDWIERQTVVYYGYGCKQWPQSIVEIDMNKEILSVNEIASAN